MKVFKVFTILAAALAFSACSTLEDFVTDSPATAELTFKYATAKIIDADVERADRVLSAVADAREFVGSDESVTVSFLYEQAVARVDFERLDPADAILIRAVIQNASERLQREVGGGVLNGEQEIRLLTILDWVESAARASAI